MADGPVLSRETPAHAFERFDELARLAELAASYWSSTALAADRGDIHTALVHCRQIAAVTREAFAIAKVLGAEEAEEVNEAGSDVERLVRAQQERDRIRLAFPAEYDDGAQRALLENKLYPSGFSAWPLERRTAWFAGYNLGYCTRLRALQEIEGGDG